MEHIAALIEAAATARASTTVVYRTDFGRRFKQHESGMEDFVRHLRSTRRAQDGAEHLQAGPDILHRLSEEEQHRTGKSWRWEGDVCPYQEGERAEMAAALRLHVAEPRSATTEKVDGERLRRYSFRVETWPDHKDAVIAHMYDHLRHHQTTQIVFEVWLTDDGGLRRTRERANARARKQGYTVLGWTTDYWDFGVATEIAVPSPDQILRASDGPTSSNG